MQGTGTVGTRDDPSVDDRGAVFADSKLMVVTSRSVTSINLTLPGSVPRPDGSPSSIRGTLDLPGSVPAVSGEVSAESAAAFRRSGTPVAVVAHGFTCNRRAPGVFRISRALARSGVACLRFDFPGFGDSGPDNGGVAFRDTTFSSNVDDLVTVSGWLAERLATPSLLVGHSLGGAAVLRAARRVDSVAAVATVGAPYLPGRAATSLLAAFSDEDGTEDSTGAAGAVSEDDCRTVTLAGRPLEFRRRFLTDLAEYSVPTTVDADVAALGRRGVPLLIMHSPTDQTVPVTDAVSLFTAASWPKSLLSIPDADHLLTRRGSARRVGEMIADWTAAVGISR